MELETLEKIPAIAPLEFFSLECNLLFSEKSPLLKRSSDKYLLPSTCDLLNEKQFANVWMAWNETGIFVNVEVLIPFEECQFPQFSEADALELFFDTRDLKTASFLTRFSHHFLFLAKSVQGVQCQEITRFRTEDTHPLADPHRLQISSHFEKSSYTLDIFIPKDCLHGFEPTTFNRLGFTYRIHRKKGKPQHFALSSEHFKIEQHPKLWACLHLRKI